MSLSISRMPRQIGRALLIAAGCLILAGSDAGRAYRDGKDFDEGGQDFKAAEKYLEALDADAGHKKAMEALKAVAKDAYDEKLSEAQDSESAKDYPSALRSYDDLATLIAGLKDHDASSFSVIDAKAKSLEMRNSAAETDYQAAEKFFTAKSWEAAIRHYDSAISFMVAYKDCQEKRSAAYYAWGDDQEKAHQYRAAIGDFENAGDNGFYKDAAARSGSIEAALGRYFLDKNLCRQAVADLRSAKQHLSSTDLDTDLAKAEDCAITPVAILPFENPTGTNLAGMALGDTLADATTAKVQAGASEYLRLLERSALDAILSEQGLSASGISSGSTTKVKGVRYLAIGKITQVKLERPAPTATAGATPGQLPYDCQKTRNDGTAYTATCYTDVSVAYVDHQASVNARVVASLRIVDVATGQQLALQSLESSVSKAVRWADNTHVGTQAVDVVRGGHTGGVQVGDALVTLAAAPQALPSDDAIASAIVDDLSTRGAQAVLTATDTAPSAPDPVTLTVAPLH